MSQRIVDVFEMIQIQKDHGNRSVLAASQGNRLNDPVAEQQLGRFVTGSCCAECVIWLDMARTALTSWKTITAPVTRPARIVDRRGRIFNGGFKSVAADENAIHS